MDAISIKNLLETLKAGRKIQGKDFQVKVSVDDLISILDETEMLRKEILGWWKSTKPDDLSLVQHLERPTAGLRDEPYSEALAWLAVEITKSKR